MELEGDYRKNDFESILPIRPLRIMIENIDRLNLKRPLSAVEVRKLYPAQLLKLDGFGMKSLKIVDLALKKLKLPGWLLLNCPFCGGKPHVNSMLRDGYKPEDDKAYQYWIHCQNCLCQTHYETDVTLVEEKWNARARIDYTKIDKRRMLGR